MNILDDLPIVATAIQFAHEGYLLDLEYLPDGTPCYWGETDGEGQPVPIAPSDWLAESEEMRAVLIAAMKSRRQPAH